MPTLRLDEIRVMAQTEAQRLRDGQPASPELVQALADLVTHIEALSRRVERAEHRLQRVRQPRAVIRNAIRAPFSRDAAPRGTLSN